MKRRILWIVISIVALLGAAAWSDYRAYSRRTNAAAVWAWLFTRWFELTGDPESLWKTERLRKLRKDDTCRPALLSQNDVPRRSGERPKMVRGVPHRQIDQHAGPEMRSRMDTVFTAGADFAGGRKRTLYRPSLWELTGASAFVLQDCTLENCHPSMLRTKGEFAHMHSHDGSFHAALSAADVATVIEAGWGEFFPASGLAGGRVPYVILIYAPRNEGELEIARRILRAAHKLALHPAPERECRLNPP